MNELQELKDQMQKLQKRIEELEEEWPKEGDTYWVVSSTCEVNDFEWNGGRVDFNFRELGNFYRTKEEADSEAMRRKSMVKRWRPEKEGRYWFWNAKVSEVCSSQWLDWDIDKLYFFIGNCHKTEEEAEEWGKTYAPHWMRLLEKEEA